MLSLHSFFLRALRTTLASGVLAGAVISVNAQTVMPTPSVPTPTVVPTVAPTGSVTPTAVSVPLLSGDDSGSTLLLSLMAAVMAAGGLLLWAKRDSSR